MIFIVFYRSNFDLFIWLLTFDVCYFWFDDFDLNLLITEQCKQGKPNLNMIYIYLFKEA